MSNQWYTIFGPKTWPGVTINTGNKKIDGTYYNVLGDKNIQLSASGTMWLVGASGIQLISKDFVDASGIRAKNLRYQNISKIDNNGNIISPYPGPDGAFIFRSGAYDLAAIPNDNLIFNTGLNAITLPSYNYGPLYVSSGNADAPSSHELKSFNQIEYIESEPDVLNNSVIPAKIINNALTKFTAGIQIYPNFDGFKGNILTHMGADTPAEWAPASYLDAEGVLWNRFLKRPVKIEDGRIIFYVNAPAWAQGENFTTLTLDILKQEFGVGFDTIELVRNDTREITYIKFAAEVRYGAAEDDIDLQTPLEELFSLVDVKDPDAEDPDATVQGYAVKICTPIPWSDKAPHIGNGFAFSVSKGAYLDMQLGRSAQNRYNCQQEDVDTSLLRFKPSTMNSISIRPNIYTAFNMLGENIDFIVYGQQKTRYGNYEETIFGLNENNIPSGLVPAFKIDANTPNAASGSPSSGIYFTKYLDRAKLTPSGWIYDTMPKIMINTSGAYIISSLATGLLSATPTPITGYLHNYADLTINSTLYSPNIIAQDIYLRPLPIKDNTGKYISNALLTIDQSGKIVSRIPKSNPTAPGKPSKPVLDPDSGGVGNGELSISWTAPTSDGNSDIINYLIQFSNNDGATWADLASAQSYIVVRATNNSTRATIKGLSALVNYKFKIAAQNSYGISAYSDASDSMAPGSSVPKAPYDLSYIREFDTSIYSDIQLSWEAGHQGSSAILGYRIEESIDYGTTWQNYNDTSNLISTTYEVIGGTESQLDLYYRVSAYNNFGQSAYSYIYASGNLLPDQDTEASQEKETDVLSNWDFGSVLFTGVCPT